MKTSSVDETTGSEDTDGSSGRSDVATTVATAASAPIPATVFLVDEPKAEPWPEGSKGSTDVDPPIGATVSGVGSRVSRVSGSVSGVGAAAATSVGDGATAGPGSGDGTSPYSFSGSATGTRPNGFSAGSGSRSTGSSGLTANAVTGIGSGGSGAISILLTSALPSTGITTVFGDGAEVAAGVEVSAGAGGTSLAQATSSQSNVSFSSSRRIVAWKPKFWMRPLSTGNLKERIFFPSRRTFTSTFFRR